MILTAKRSLGPLVASQNLQFQEGLVTIKNVNLYFKTDDMLRNEWTLLRETIMFLYIAFLFQCSKSGIFTSNFQVRNLNYLSLDLEELINRQE